VVHLQVWRRFFTQPLPLLNSDVVEWKSNSVPLVHETASFEFSKSSI
jgi:hypothetical protein